MPKLWNETIQDHRRQVRETILHTTWELVAEHGLRAVTMSQIAAGVGIGRATLYKYFPDVETILVEWHHRHIVGHLEHLTQLRDQPGDPAQRLHAVLNAYAQIVRRRSLHGPELGVLLHRHELIAGAQEELTGLIQELLVEVSRTGRLRHDVPPEELAKYCLHALGAAERLTTEAAVQRLVRLTLSGLRPEGQDSSPSEDASTL